MRILRTILLFALVFPPGVDADLNAADSPTWMFLVDTATSFDYSQVPPSRAVFVLLGVSKSCQDCRQNDLADRFLRQAINIAKSDTNRRFHGQLFDYALAVQRLDLAQDFANESKGKLRLTRLDRLAVARFRNGDKDAIKGYPKSKSTLYNALDLANAYVDMGDYQSAEESVTGIEISEENDPLDVTSMTLMRIANRCRENGDLENAKKYIDKALNIGGNQYYTGYVIQIAHRSIHNELTKELDRFARRGAAYGGHMGRELIRNLAMELANEKFYDEAKKTARRLKKVEDVHSILNAIASEQAKSGELIEASKTVEGIDSSVVRARARVGIAKVMFEKGNIDGAKKMAQIVARMDIMSDAHQHERLSRELAYLFGLLNSQMELASIISQTKEPMNKAFCVLHAFKGYAKSKRLR